MTQTVNITIESLVINVFAREGEQQEQHDPIGAMIAHARAEAEERGEASGAGFTDDDADPEIAVPEGDAPAETTGEASAEVETGTAPAESAPAITRDNVLAFLHSDPRYTMRSVTALVEYFTDDPEQIVDLQNLVMTMVSEGTVKELKQRGTGNLLYKAVAPAPVFTHEPAEPAAEHTLPEGVTITPAAEPAAPAITAANLLAFLRSHPRYTLRTYEAIAKHFATDPSEDGALADLVIGMEDEGAINTKIRRRDGATLYSAA